MKSHSIDRKRMPQVWALDTALQDITGVSITEVVEASLNGTEKELTRKIHEHTKRETGFGRPS